MSVELFCGDPMCKRPVTIPAGTSWPFFCPSCAAALYPRDLKDKLVRDDLKPRAMDLMTDSRGMRVPIDAAQLEKGTRSASPRAKAGPTDLDAILDMVDIDPAAAASARRRRMLLVVSLVIAVLLALYFGFLRR